MKKLLISFLALFSCITMPIVPQPTTNNLYDTMIILPSMAYKTTKYYYDKMMNSQWVKESLLMTSFFIIQYCNYASYKNYQQLQLIPQEDRQKATQIFTEFIMKTVISGRQSYSTNALLYDDTHSLPTELIQGYHDIVKGNTYFALTENQMKAFKLLGSLSLKGTIGFVGSGAFLCYACNNMTASLFASTSPVQTE